MSADRLSAIRQRRANRFLIGEDYDWLLTEVDRLTGMEATSANVAAKALAEAQAAVSRLRDLTSRLGFGDNITEPQAHNDTIVRWFEEQSRDANEWQESQLWRQECYWQECPDDEDCREHDPRLRLEDAEAAIGRVRGLLAAYGEAEGTPVDYEFLVSQIGAAIADETER